MFLDIRPGNEGYNASLSNTRRLATSNKSMPTHVVEQPTHTEKTKRKKSQNSCPNFILCPRSSSSNFSRIIQISHFQNHTTPTSYPEHHLPQQAHKRTRLPVVLTTMCFCKISRLPEVKNTF